MFITQIKLADDNISRTTLQSLTDSAARDGVEKIDLIMI